MRHFIGLTGEPGFSSTGNPALLSFGGRVARKLWLRWVGSVSVWAGQEREERSGDSAKHL